LVHYALLAVTTLGGLAFVVVFLNLTLSLKKTIAKSGAGERENLNDQKDNQDE